MCNTKGTEKAGITSFASRQHLYFFVRFSIIHFTLLAFSGGDRVTFSR
jgi:hypothetical protein